MKYKIRDTPKSL